MPENLEIKLRAINPGKLEHIARSLGTPIFVGQQTDTYFKVRTGRLKLRQIPQSAELIFYHRPNKAAARRSQYFTLEVHQPRKVKSSLTKLFGIKGVVKKHRKIYLCRKVRIHLDEVEGLGSFFEIEIPSGGKTKQAHSQMKSLLRRFGLQKEPPIRGSYSDMLLKSRK